MNKPTSALLPNLHPMAVNYLGQNYMVNGFLAFQMECLGESTDYDYWFFAGVGGDAHTQLYTTNLSRCPQSLSQIDFTPEHARKWYDAVGYDFTIVTEEQFNADRPRYVRELMHYIDRGIPVITKHTVKEEEFSVVVGYEDGGDQLLFGMDGDPGPGNWPFNVPTNQNLNHLFIFPGAKKQAPPLADAYRNAVLQIPELLTRPHKGDLYYGREAFEQWADHLLAEDYAGWTDEQIGLWEVHGTYVCFLATNGSCRAFLERAQQLCPDLPFLAEVDKEYVEMGRIWTQELAPAGGSFDITCATLRNTEAKRPIAEIIRRCTACCDRIIEIYRKNGYAN